MPTTNDALTSVSISVVTLGVTSQSMTASPQIFTINPFTSLIPIITSLFPTSSSPSTVSIPPSTFSLLTTSGISASTTPSFSSFPPIITSSQSFTTSRSSTRTSQTITSSTSPSASAGLISQPQHHLPVALIVTLVSAFGFIALVAAVFLLFSCYRRRQRKREPPRPTTNFSRPWRSNQSSETIIRIFKDPLLSPVVSTSQFPMPPRRTPVPSRPQTARTLPLAMASGSGPPPPVPPLPPPMPVTPTSPAFFGNATQRPVVARGRSQEVFVAGPYTNTGSSKAPDLPEPEPPPQISPKTPVRSSPRRIARTPSSVRWGGSVSLERPGSQAESFYAPWVQDMMASGTREISMDAMGAGSGRVRVSRI